MFRRIFSLKTCCKCNNEYISGNNVTHCPTCDTNLSLGDNSVGKRSLADILNINNFFGFGKGKKYNEIKKKSDKEIVDEQNQNKSENKESNSLEKKELEKQEDSGYDTDSEYETDSEEDVLPYDINDYIVNNYEKDLEMAINLSLKNKEFCVICFDKSINAVFIPCGHYCCCYKCAKKCAKKCPICRKKIKLVQKIYK